MPRLLLHQQNHSKSYLGDRIGVTPKLINGLLCCFVQLLCFVYNENWKYKGTMTDTRVTSIIIIYRQRIYKPYVPSKTYGRATMGASGAPNKLFIVFLFRGDDVGVQFFLTMWDWIQREWCAVNADHKCPGASTLVFRSFNDGDIWGPYLLPHAVHLLQLVTVLDFSTVTWSLWKFYSSSTTYVIVHRDLPNTIQQEHQFCSATIRELAKLCRDIMLDYVPGSSQKIFGPKKTVEFDDSKFDRRKYTK